MNNPALPFLRALLLIGRGVFLELTRKREFYVMLILMSLYVIGVIVVSIVGIENGPTATLILNLGMTVSWAVVHLLTLLLITRQIPDEIDKRTLYPLLARPLERRTYVLGKWAATTVCGFACLLVLLLLAWVPVPKVQTYNATLFLQMFTLGLFSIAMMASLGLFFSLFMPRGVIILVLSILFLLSDKIIGVLSAFSDDKAIDKPIEWFVRYIPNFRLLNLITRYTDGVDALPAPSMAGLILYGLVVIAVSLAASMYIFERRAL